MMMKCTNKYIVCHNFLTGGITKLLQTFTMGITKFDWGITKLLQIFTMGITSCCHVKQKKICRDSKP